MSPLLLGIVTFIYVGVAISAFFEGRNGISLMFVGYAVANVGLIYDLTKG